MILHTMLYHSLFSHSPVNGHLGLSFPFSLSFILNNGAMYIIEYAKKKKKDFVSGRSWALPCCAMPRYVSEWD